MQSAAVYVRELKGVKEELVRRNEELELRSARNSNVEGQEIKIRVVANHESTLDSMIGALQCLKAMDVKARSVRTNFSDHEFIAVMKIESKVSQDKEKKNVILYIFLKIISILLDFIPSIV